MNITLNMPQNIATNTPLSSPCMQLLANQYSSKANIIGIKFQTRTLICRTHINHRKRCIPILSELQTNTMNYGNNMGTDQSESYQHRKPRFLCLHGFRTSGEILKKQIDVKWPKSLREKLDLLFVDAPFPCQGKSDVEKIFDPPYYEWFGLIHHEEFTEYENLDECLAYVEDCMIKYEPFDGLLGFSQGAALAAVLAGLQAKGLALTKVPKIKYLIMVGSSLPKNQGLVDRAYSSTVQCPSVHFIGEKDYLKEDGIKLLKSFVDPVVIYHSKGHIVPRLDGENLKIMEKFLERIQREVNCGTKTNNMSREYFLAST